MDVGGAWSRLRSFDGLNAVAEDEALFDSVWDGAEGVAPPLPPDDAFIVAHAMGRDTPPHTHDYHELCYVARGRVLNRVEGRDGYLLADSVAVMGAGTTHQLVSVDADAVVVNLCLRPALFEGGVFADFLAQGGVVARTLRGEADSPCLVLSDARGEVLSRSMVALLREYRHAGERAGFAVLGRVLLLLAQLSEIRTYSFYGIDETMMRVLSRIEEGCAEVSVGTLAREFGYNESYFSQYVRAHTGMRASTLIAEARMRRAVGLLRTTTIPVEEIARAVGYRSASHFHHVFADMYHITPAAYRAFASPEVGGA